VNHDLRATACHHLPIFDEVEVDYLCRMAKDLICMVAPPLIHCARRTSNGQQPEAIGRCEEDVVLVQVLTISDQPFGDSKTSPRKYCKDYLSFE